MTTSADECVPPSFGIRTALVLSRDPSLRRETRAHLEALGLRTREIATLATLAEASPRIDLVLYDVRDQPKGAISLARTLRRASSPPHLGVLVLAPRADDELALSALEEGADDVLTLPLHPVVFGARVRASLNRSILHEKHRLGLEALKESRRELATAIESMSYGFALFGPDGLLRLANQRFYAMYPAASAPARAQTLGVILCDAEGDADLDEADAQRRREERVRALGRGEPQRIAAEGGRTYEIRGSATPSGGLVTAHEDVTERVQHELRLQHLALHDPLTGLSNRAHFEEVLERTLHGARRGDECFALLYIDLDGFKSVNDGRGHGVGDRLLAHVASILRETVREGDLVARIGGDEFAVLSRNTRTAPEVGRICERLKARLGERFPDGPGGVPIGLSVGCVLHPSSGAPALDASALVARADSAMYAAKRAGGRRVVFSSATLPAGDQSNLGGRFS